ncbi:MAG TPA: SDR family NAD(P)-dependent oxidoreductase [Patescibacteria group bacterium]
MDSINKVAIVTGAGQGIGQGIAMQLANDGFTVVVSDLNQETAQQTAGMIEQAGGKAMAVKTDVSQKAEVDDMFAQVMSTYGKVDVLVNNAGIYPFISFTEMTEANWDKVMAVNLKSVFLCCQAAAKVMQPGSRMVTITSIASFIGYEGLVHYCATKGAINAMTRALALEMGHKDITVNAVAPGATKTPGASMNEDMEKQTISTIPLNRMGTPQDIGGAVSFLVSDKASYITGQVITVDGGIIAK